MTIIMGILNVTPDSFSDGGKFLSAKDAVDQGQYLIDDGAHMIDIGGQSTAPKRTEVSADEELRRVLPVIEGLIKKGITNLSIDTSKALVAKEALDRGVIWINDQTAGFRDEEIINLYKRAKKVVLMHHQGQSKGVDEGEENKYQDILGEISNFFSTRINDLLKKNILKKEQIIIDPGIGFGKGLKDSLKIIKNISILKELNFDIMIGLSRKSFIGKIIKEDMADKRDYASLILEYESILNGVNIIRTHNVKKTCQALKIIDAFEL